MKRTIVLFAMGTAVAIYGCDDDVDVTASPPATDAAAGGDSTSSGDGGTGGEAGDPDGGTTTDSGDLPDSGDLDSDVDAAIIPAPCTEAELDDPGADRTDGGTVTITFPNGPNPMQYSPRCVKIKAGQTVTWDGKFENHPLTPYGGDTPNPIPMTSTTPGGGLLTLTFSAVGTFGFRCGAHPTQMNGAVKIVP